MFQAGHGSIVEQPWHGVIDCGIFMFHIHYKYHEDYEIHDMFMFHAESLNIQWCTHFRFISLGRLVISPWIPTSKWRSQTSTQTAWEHVSSSQKSVGLCWFISCEYLISPEGKPNSEKKSVGSTRWWRQRLPSMDFNHPLPMWRPQALNGYTFWCKTRNNKNLWLEHTWTIWNCFFFCYSKLDLGWSWPLVLVFLFF